MIRTFIYSEPNNNWIAEEEHLLLHDLCALLDEEDKILYVWNGPKSTTSRLEKGFLLAENLVSSMPEPIQLTILTEDVPPKIQKKLDKMLDIMKKEEEEEIIRFTNLFRMRLFFVLQLFTIILPIISLLNVAGYLFWRSNLLGEYEVLAENYDLWINTSLILISITLIIFIVNIILGVIEGDMQVIVFSGIGLIVCIGMVIYLSQGVYLFLFLEDSTREIYIISINDLGLFFLANFLATLVFLIPNLYKLIDFYKIYQNYLF